MLTLDAVVEAFWNRCLSEGISSFRVRLPTSVRHSENHRWRQELRRTVALPKNTRASSSIPLTTSGSGASVSSSSSATRFRAEGAAKIGRAVTRNVACFSTKPSSKEKISLVLLKPCFFRMSYFIPVSIVGAPRSVSVPSISG